MGCSRNGGIPRFKALQQRTKKAMLFLNGAVSSLFSYSQNHTTQ